MTEQRQDDEEEAAEQVRVTFTLDSTVKDLSLRVPSEPISIPSSLRRKGLSAVINHLLDRKISHDDDEIDDEEDDDDEDKLPAVTFDFMICGKLLRTGVETAARRFGLSLEESIHITYFPAQEAPEDDGESEPLPDWISCLSFTNQKLCSAAYDGTLRIHQTIATPDPTNKKIQTLASVQAHSGPIKCMASCSLGDDSILIATGSLDQSLATHRYTSETSLLRQHALYKEGHTSSIGSVDLHTKTHLLVSGDWDGNLCVWKTRASSGQPDVSSESEAPTKKSKSKTGKANATQIVIKPSTIVSSAHSSQISGVAWMADGNHVVTGSWDHSVKVWSVESQDCLLTLNGARVVSCMDLSPHSEVVATGHPDCTIRLWDIRTNAVESGSLVSDTTLKPSHKAWVASVKWSPKDPYILSSASHDGTLKIWDIRSSLPLHTVRTHAKQEKSLCSVYGNGIIYLAGTDGVVKQYTC
jgi:ribosome biogenesis protein YTM1